MGRTVRLLLVCVVAHWTIGCATSSSSSRFPSQSASIQNFQSVSPGLYRGAQPTEAGLKSLKELGIKTIVSLRIPPQVVAWETGMADQLDMDFVSLPLSNYDSPSERQLREFLKIVTDPTRQPVFVHCRKGSLRTGAMIAGYRVIQEGWTVKQAYAEAKRFGFDNQSPWFLPLKWFIFDLSDYLHLAVTPPAKLVLSRPTIASSRPAP